MLIVPVAMADALRAVRFDPMPVIAPDREEGSIAALMVPNVSWDAFKLVSAKPLADIAVTEIVDGSRLVLMVPVVRADALRASRLEPVPEKFAEIAAGNWAAPIVPDNSWDAFRLVSAKPLAEIADTVMVDGKRLVLIVPEDKVDAFKFTRADPSPFGGAEMFDDSYTRVIDKVSPDVHSNGVSEATEYDSKSL